MILALLSSSFLTSSWDWWTQTLTSQFTVKRSKSYAIITRVYSYKYFGLHVDSNLSWDVRVNSVCSWIQQLLHFLRWRRPMATWCGSHCVSACLLRVWGRKECTAQSNMISWTYYRFRRVWWTLDQGSHTPWCRRSGRSCSDRLHAAEETQEEREKRQLPGTTKMAVSPYTTT